MLARTRTALTGLIATGVVLRFVSAFFSLGPSHPNEFYRLLEPIAGLEGYSTRLPWEWKDGLLSVLPVYAHLALLKFVGLFGLSTPIQQLIFLKIIYAALSLILIWATWRLLKKFAPGWELAGAAFMSLWPEFIYQSVRLMDYSLEAAFLGAAIAVSFGAENETKLRSWFWAGLLLGCAFFVRFQSGVYLVAFLLAIAVLPRGKRVLSGSALVTGYGICVLALGFLETELGHRPFLEPFFRYVDFNWFQNGAARFYGTAPWHRYLSEAAQYFGFVPFALGISAVIYSGFKKELKWPLAILALFPILVLSLIAHKEGRFAYGCFWLLVPLAISAFQSIRNGRRILTAVFGLAILIGWGINFARVTQVYFSGSQDVRDWAAAGKRLEDSRAPLTVEVDPDFVPGAFFLRYSGPICYRYVKDGKSEAQGQCEIASHEPGIVFAPGPAGWK